jgi:hypothetical protein
MMKVSEIFKGYTRAQLKFLRQQEIAPDVSGKSEEREHEQRSNNDKLARDQR